MNCLYCHFSANKAMDPGLPAVNTCMGCHTVVTAQRPALDGLPARTSEGIEKLTTYWKNKQPDSVGARAQGAGLRSVPAHASRERWRHLPDLPRTSAADDASLPVRTAQHGVVRQLSHRQRESRVESPLRLQHVSLLGLAHE